MNNSMINPGLLAFNRWLTGKYRFSFQRRGAFPALFYLMYGYGCKYRDVVHHVSHNRYHNSFHHTVHNMFHNVFHNEFHHVSLNRWFLPLTLSAYPKSTVTFFKPRRHLQCGKNAKGREGNWPQTNPNKKFWEVQGTYSAVLRNIHGDDTSFEATYAVLALQIVPHAVGFSKRVLGRRRHRLAVNLGYVSALASTFVFTNSFTVFRDIIRRRLASSILEKSEHLRTNAKFAGHGRRHMYHVLSRKHMVVKGAPGIRVVGEHKVRPYKGVQMPVMRRGEPWVHPIKIHTTRTHPTSIHPTAIHTPAIHPTGTHAADIHATYALNPQSAAIMGEKTGIYTSFTLFIPFAEPSQKAGGTGAISIRVPGIRVVGEHKVRPYKGVQMPVMRRGEPCVHPIKIHTTRTHPTTIHTTRTHPTSIHPTATHTTYIHPTVTPFTGPSRDDFTFLQHHLGSDGNTFTSPKHENSGKGPIFIHRKYGAGTTAGSSAAVVRRADETTVSTVAREVNTNTKTNRNTFVSTFASAQGIDIRQLTDRVYRQLERRLKAEKERRGW